MALLTHTFIPGRTLAVYNLHCESRGGDDLRHSQLDEFLRHVKSCSLDVPVLAAGDFNFDLSEGRAAAVLADAGFLNPFATLRQPTTNSYSTQNGAIDWILLRGSLIGTNAQVHNSVLASDHYPLSLTVSFY